MQVSVNWPTILIGGKSELGIRWHGDDLPSGVTITSATASVSPAVGLTLEAPIVNADADGIYCWATAVTAGAYYVTVIATRSDGGKNVEYGRVEVDTLALSSAALITANEARTLLGWKAGSHADDDVKLATVIESVSVAFQSESDPDLTASTAIVETRNGTGKSYLYLDHYPVTDIDSVVEDGVTLVENTDYYADYDEGLLEKPTGYKWTTARGGVVATYDAGYAAVPADVKLACLIEVGRAFDLVQKKMFGESGRSQEGVSITISTDELLPATLTTLGRYKRTRI